jgi:hypothetical protein
MATPSASNAPSRSLVDKVLNSPIAALAPWIVMALLNGEGRFELSVGVAFGLSALLLGGTLVRGQSPKLLEFADVTFFAILGVIGLVASDSTIDWLENWAGEISNIALVVIAGLSMLIRMPFTLQYARETVDRSLWDNPVFIHINYVITGFWTGAFLVGAIAGFVGDAILDDSDNLWTGWILQTGAIIVAIKFTEWYPDYGAAKAREKAGVQGEPAPPVSKLLVPLAGFLTPVGILALIFDAAPTWVGVGLIVVGAVLTQQLARAGDDEHVDEKAMVAGRSGG